MSYVTLNNSQVAVKKIICVGANYPAHNAEMGREEKPESFLFLKPPTALIPGDKPIEIPPFTTNLHHEVEMVLLMGGGGYRLKPEQAVEQIQGVGAGLDLTARDLQQRAKEHGLPWSMSKGFNGAARVTDMVEPGEFADLSDLNLTLAVNGEIRQQGSTADMLLDPAALICFASRFFTIEPGDLIFTGTPAGVGPLKPGDVVEIDLQGTVGAEYTVQEEMDVSKC